MKNIFFSLATIAVLVSGYFIYNNSTNTPIQKEKIKITYSTDRLENVKKQAQKEGKLVIVKVTMEGCTMCGKFEKETFSTTEVQEAINDDFIIFDVDIFDPLYQDLFKQHEIKATPTTLFLNENGKELVKVIGARDKDIFLEGVEIALEKDIEYSNLKENDFHEHLEEENPHDHGHTKEKRKVYNTESKRSYFVDIDKNQKMEEHNRKFLLEKGNLDLKVFPNPNDGNFKVKLEGSEKETLLKFTTIDGKYLIGEKIEGSSFAKTLEYNFSEEAGVILLRAEQGRNVATEKIIIQK